MRQLSSRLGFCVLIGWAVLFSADARAQAVTLALVPADPNAASWNLLLDCPGTGVAGFTTGFVLPQNLDPAAIIDFGPGCGPLDPMMPASCAGANLPVTVDVNNSFVLGPGFMLAGSGTRLDTLYVHLQAPLGGALCMAGTSGNVVANFILPLPGPVHTRQGADQLSAMFPAEFPPGFFTDMGATVQPREILFFRGALPPVIFGVGARRPRFPDRHSRRRGFRDRRSSDRGLGAARPRSERRSRT